MSTKHTTVSLIILVSILAAAVSAFVITKTEPAEPAESGITNKQAQKLPLKELQSLLHDISSDQAFKKHTGGDVIIVSYDYAYLMTQTQWESVADRVVDAIQKSDGQKFLDAAGFAQLIEQYLRSDKKLATQLKFQEIIDAAITRLHDPDINIVRNAAYIAGNFPSVVPNKVDIKHLLKLAESSPTPAHNELITQCIASLRFSQKQSPSVDSQIVSSARVILEDTAATRSQRMEALSSIKNTTSAAREAATLAAEQYLNPPHDDQLMVLFVLTQLVSIDDNPDVESRQIATEIAIPIFMQAANSNDWSLQMSAAGTARHLYSKAEPLIPALLEMVDHPDINVSGMAITALGYIGPRAKNALPKLRSISGTRGDLNKSILDSLYLIAKEGDKPDWYDRYIENLKKTGVAVD